MYRGKKKEDEEKEKEENVDVNNKEKPVDVKPRYILVSSSWSSICKYKNHLCQLNCLFLWLLLVTNFDLIYSIFNFRDRSPRRRDNRNNRPIVSASGRKLKGRGAIVCLSCSPYIVLSSSSFSLCL